MLQEKTLRLKGPTPQDSARSEDETNVPATSDEKGQNARFSCAHVHQGGTQSHQPAASQGTQAFGPLKPVISRHPFAGMG
jgi:hypothetical protein